MKKFEKYLLAYVYILDINCYKFCNASLKSFETSILLKMLYLDITSNYKKNPIKDIRYQVFPFPSLLCFVDNITVP